MQVPHIYKAGPINPKRETVSESLRGLDRLVKKENSKNLRQKKQINKLLLGDFFGGRGERLTRFKFEDGLYFSFLKNGGPWSG